jgi:hypothetical protein
MMPMARRRLFALREISAAQLTRASDGALELSEKQRHCD